MKLGAIGVVLLVISGCTTMSDFTAKAPRLEGSSAKSSSDFINCVKSEWGVVRPVNQVTLTDKTQRVLIPSDFGPAAVLDVTEIESGVSFKYYQAGYDFGTLQKITKGAVSGCQ